MPGSSGVGGGGSASGAEPPPRPHGLALGPLHHAPPLGFHPERASSGRSEAMELPAPIKIPTASKGGSGGCAAQHPPPPSPPSTQPCPREPPHPHVCSSTGCHTNPPPRNPSKVAAKSGEGREEKSIFLVFALCSLGAGGRRAKRDLDFKCCRGANRRAWPGHQRAAAGPETTHSSGLFLGSGGCRTRLPRGLNSVVWEVP